MFYLFIFVSNFIFSVYRSLHRFFLDVYEKMTEQRTVPIQFKTIESTLDRSKRLETLDGSGHHGYKQLGKG